MAYDREEILKQALTAIDTEECVTIEEVLLYLPISKKTFYDWELHELHDLKDAINSMKIKLKKGMRRNWRKSDNATLQIAEFKLMANPDEADALNTSKVKQENTHKFDDIPKITFIEAGSTDNGNQSI
jgi:hypothetical protein